MSVPTNNNPASPVSGSISDNTPALACDSLSTGPAVIHDFASTGPAVICDFTSTGAPPPCVNTSSLDSAPTQGKDEDTDMFDAVAVNHSGSTSTPSSVTSMTVEPNHSSIQLARSTFDSTADQVNQSIKKYKLRLYNLSLLENKWVDTVVTNMEQLEARDFELMKISQDTKFYNRQLAETSALLASLQDASVKMVTSQATGLSLSDNRVSSPVVVKNHLSIPSSKIPAFDPKTYSDDPNSVSTSAGKSLSFNSFILKFEREYLNHDVDINLYWSFHLEAAFEVPGDFHAWFLNNIKDKTKIKTWAAAKQVLINRFDVASRAGLVIANQNLLALRQPHNEPLAEYIDRFTRHYLAAKVNINDNFLLTCLFLGSLYTKEFQDKVQEQLVNHMKSNNMIMDSSMRSKHATFNDADFKNYYSDFSEVMEVLNNNLGTLESALVVIKRKHSAPKSASPSSSSSGSNSKDSSKKRKIENRSPSSSSPSAPSSGVDFSLIWDVNHKLNSDEVAHLRSVNKCLSCRTNEFSKEHMNSCVERKKFLASRMVSRSSNPVTVLSNTISNNVSNIVPSNSSANNCTSSLSSLSSSFVASSPSLSLFSDDEDEYQLALKELDNFIYTDNNESDSNDGFFYNNKNIFSIKIVPSSSNCLNTFSIKSNNVGDIDNPFKTDNVAYSPVTPIIINSIKSYGILDSGAQVSVMTKQFALENDIKFHKIDGSLLLANGTQIDRNQTIHELSIDYDGIDKKVFHKFDIIDNKLLTTNKILIGMDLLPKLSIQLINVAHKFKDTIKAIDDSVEDQAYIPNVTPFGSPKEQRAFEIALNPYVEANKALNKNSFCNIPESVLHLPTPVGYHANVRQYPIPYKLQPKVMEVINDWVKDGIIVRAPASAWNLPITVAIKKNHDSGVASSKDDVTKEDLRVVLDTRLLNKALPTINETQPLINDIFFSSMEGCSVFSTIDLKSAFSQFRVNSEDQIKTSFTGPDNLKYMHVGSPFGISTISQLFSRIILTLFKDLTYVRSFIDDICIMSRNLEIHFQHVKHVLTILTKANLRINFKKSHFAKAEVYLLGFSISAKGRRIDTRKLTNLESLPRPVTSKQCQSFLGFVNYFRQHIPNAAMLTAPLDFLRSHDEKNKGKRFEWSSTHDMHFNFIKKILVSDVVLSHPDLNHPFCIATDASDYAIGCSLFQEFKTTTADGSEKTIIKHIGFFSRKMSSSEMRYSCTMREMLACIFALKQFHKFVWGTHFTLYSDHKALSYLHTQKYSNSMMIKWLDIILDYDFKVVYIKGIDNILPDSLSRLYPPTVDSSKDQAKQLRLSSLGKNRAISENINLHKKTLSLRSIQVRDPYIQNLQNLPSLQQNEINHQKRLGALNSVDLRSVDSFPITNNIVESNSKRLFYIQSSQNIHADYLIAPESERKILLEDAHNKVGHYGAEQMVKRLHQEGIHWPKLINDCIEFIRKCKECQKHNIQKRGYHPLRPIYSYLPGDHYAIDLGGPINTTSVRGNNYFLVIVCVATRFCVLRPLQDKRSDTVLTALVDVFSILGFPCGGIIQSDNGTDFKHRLAADLAEAMGIDHRFITPMHASANGISERFVQSVKRLLAKATQGIGNDWDLHLNAVQLALNNRISKKLNTTPFSLMFARKMAEPFGFRTSGVAVPPEQRKPISHEELMKRIDYMADIVFPAIHAKTMAQLDLEKAKFDNKHLLVDYPPDSHVMVRLQTKAGQLAPSYVGPYTVVRKNRGNSYILRDHLGCLMPRNYTSVELKLISQDEVIEVDDEGKEIKSYEVEAILNHRGTPTNREYLVRWKNYSSDWDEWINQDQFNATDTLREYWKKLGLPYKAKKSNVITNSPTSISILKNNPPGSVSKLIDSFSDNDDDIVIVTPAARKKQLSQKNSCLKIPVGNKEKDSSSTTPSHKRKNKNPGDTPRRSKRHSVKTRST